MNILYTKKGLATTLPIEILDASGQPVAGIALANIDIVICNVVDNTTTTVHPTSELDSSGVYLYAHTSTGEDVVVHVEYGGLKWNEYLIHNSDLFAEDGIGPIGLYGLATINGVPTSQIRVRLFDADNTALRDFMTSAVEYVYPGDVTKTYNWELNIAESGVYKLEFYKWGYVSTEYDVVVPSQSYCYFEDGLID